MNTAGLLFFNSIDGVSEINNEQLSFAVCIFIVIFVEL